MKKPIINNKKLMLDWDWVKNNEAGLDPNILSCGSSKTAHWKCHVCAYEWTTKIQSRNKGTKCKVCLANELSTAPKEKSLAVLYPKLLKEWDYELNKITPDKVYSQSHRLYHWACHLGHKWEETTYRRTSRGNACPFCSNHRVLEGFNDLKTTHPDVLDEWDYEENNKIGIYPTSVTYGSKQVVHWKCKRGHSWKCAVYRRTTNEEGCPHCRKELRTSYPEKVVAFYFSQAFEDCLENYRLNRHTKYELDIYIPSIKVGIEYDGYKWHGDIEKDKAKDLLCTKNGITLFRVREYGCKEYDSDSIKMMVIYRNNNDLSATIIEIINIINNRFGLLKTVDIDIDRDSAIILSKAMSQTKKNSIANTILIKEWDWDKNKGVDPSFITPFSNRKFWWKCPLNHSYQAAACDRSKGNKCPYCCSQKVLKGFNDLEYKYPDLAKEWDYSKNKKKPDEVTAKSNKPYWWICPKCGYSWKTVVHVRTSSGCGCPKCKKIVSSQKIRKKVINLDTNIVYESIKEASEELNINRACISNACKGIIKTAGGYHWKFPD